MSVLQDLLRPGLTHAYLQQQLQTPAAGRAGSDSSGSPTGPRQTPAADTLQDTDILLNNGSEASCSLWIESLDVSHLSQLGLLGWQQLLGLLQETDCLRQLVARDCGIVAADASGLFYDLPDVPAALDLLKWLDLSHNSGLVVGQEIEEALCCMPHLQGLCLNHTGMTGNDIVATARLLCRLAKMRLVVPGHPYPPLTQLQCIKLGPPAECQHAAQPDLRPAAGSAQQDIDVTGAMASPVDTASKAAAGSLRVSSSGGSARGDSSGWPAQVFRTFLDILVKLVDLMPHLKIVELWGLSIMQQQQVLQALQSAADRSSLPYPRMTSPKLGCCRLLWLPTADAVLPNELPVPGIQCDLPAAATPAANRHGVFGASAAAAAAWTSGLKRPVGVGTAAATTQPDTAGASALRATPSVPHTRPDMPAPAASRGQGSIYRVQPSKQAREQPRLRHLQQRSKGSASHGPDSSSGGGRRRRSVNGQARDTYQRLLVQAAAQKRALFADDPLGDDADLDPFGSDVDAWDDLGSEDISKHDSENDGDVVIAGSVRREGVPGADAGGRLQPSAQKRQRQQVWVPSAGIVAAAADEAAADDDDDSDDDLSGFITEDAELPNDYLPLSPNPDQEPHHRRQRRKSSHQPDPGCVTRRVVSGGCVSDKGLKGRLKSGADASREQDWHTPHGRESARALAVDDRDHTQSSGQKSAAANTRLPQSSTPSSRLQRLPQPALATAGAASPAAVGGKLPNDLPSVPQELRSFEGWDREFPQNPLGTKGRRLWSNDPNLPRQARRLHQRDPTTAATLQELERRRQQREARQHDRQQAVAADNGHASATAMLCAAAGGLAEARAPFSPQLDGHNGGTAVGTEGTEDVRARAAARRMIRQQQILFDGAAGVAAAAADLCEEDLDAGCPAEDLDVHVQFPAAPAPGGPAVEDQVHHRGCIAGSSSHMHARGSDGGTTESPAHADRLPSAGQQAQPAAAASGAWRPGGDAAEPDVEDDLDAFTAAGGVIGPAGQHPRQPKYMQAILDSEPQAVDGDPPVAADVTDDGAAGELGNAGSAGTAEEEVNKLQQELAQLQKLRVKQGKTVKELRDLVKLWHWDRRGEVHYNMFQPKHSKRQSKPVQRLSPGQSGQQAAAADSPVAIPGQSGQQAHGVGSCSAAGPVAVCASVPFNAAAEPEVAAAAAAEAMTLNGTVDRWPAAAVDEEELVIPDR
eukprot:gene13783-13904_t